MELSDPQFTDSSSLENSDDIDNLIEEIRKRVTEVIETIQSFQFSDATTWPKLLEQFSILSVQYQSLQSALSDRFQYSVLKPQTPNAEIPELLSSMLLPEMYKLQDSLVNRLNSKFQGGPQRKIGEYQSIIREQEHMCTELEQQFSQLCTQMRMGQKIRANFGNNKQKVDTDVRNRLLAAIFQGNGLKHGSIDQYMRKQQEQFTAEFPSSTSSISPTMNDTRHKDTPSTANKTKSGKEIPSAAVALTPSTKAIPVNASSSNPNPVAPSSANTSRSSTPIQKSDRSSPAMMSQQPTPPQNPNISGTMPQNYRSQRTTGNAHSMVPSAGSPVSSTQRAPSPAHRSNTPIGVNSGTPSPMGIGNSPSPVNTPSQGNMAVPSSTAPHTGTSSLPTQPNPSNAAPMHHVRPNPSGMPMRFSQNNMINPYFLQYPYAMNQPHMRPHPQSQQAYAHHLHRQQQQQQYPQQYPQQHPQQQQQQPPGSGRGK